ncbi:MAG TPA: NUDIX hydrolase [Candidatus Angelobacter sp.]|nr:NUDIX hydrolase [Candidatus Angelobacter sp.]
MQREYPDRPIVGVGAVIIHNGQVLLVRRAKPPLQGRWSLPGGVVELGETLRAAVEREICEETGLVVQATEVVAVLDRILPGDNAGIQYHYVLIDFLCRCQGGELRADSDVSEAQWAYPAELARYELEQIALDVIAKGFQLSPS